MPRRLTKKQKRIDVAAPYGKITGADLKKLAKRKKNGSKKKSKKSKKLV